MTGSLADAILARVKAALDRHQGAPVPTLGTVEAVHGNGAMTVQVGARTVDATLATEEPIHAGELVWTAKTSQGQTIVHGSRR